jgi:hypothetical protein
VGILFVDFLSERPSRLRLNGVASLDERSRYVLRGDHPPPVPAWKRADWACDALPADDPARGDA